jgi:hypothetical protein
LSGAQTSNINSPGPGQYEPICETDISNVTSPVKGSGYRMGRISSPNLNRSRMSRNNKSASSVNFDAGSPTKGNDNSIHTSYIKDDLLVRLVGHTTGHLGPGMYNVPLSSFGKKSHNVRVNESIQQSYKIRSPRKRTGWSPTNSNSRDPTSPYHDENGDRSVMLRRHSFQGIPLKFS